MALLWLSSDTTYQLSFRFFAFEQIIELLTFTMSQECAISAADAWSRRDAELLPNPLIDRREKKAHPITDELQSWDGNLLLNVMSTRITDVSFFKKEFTRMKRKYIEHMRILEGRTNGILLKSKQQTYLSGTFNVRKWGYFHAKFCCDRINPICHRSHTAITTDANVWMTRYTNQQNLYNKYTAAKCISLFHHQLSKILSVFPAREIPGKMIWQMLRKFVSRMDHRALLATHLMRRESRIRVRKQITK